MKLAEIYEGFLFDLDGVLYRGAEPLPGAGETIADLRARDRHVVFLTNNSATSPEAVAERLTAMGVGASADEVITSAEIVAGRIVAEADGRSTAFVVGEEGLRSALARAGVRVLEDSPDAADYVVVGWDRHVDYEKLKRASVLVRRGARLLATNADATYPAPGGELWPGAGSLLAAIEKASGHDALVLGKPSGGLFEAGMKRAGTRNALVVGDRIETDIEGAGRAGLDSALVLTGASALGEVMDSDHLPVAILRSLRDILEERPANGVRDATAADADHIRSLLETTGLSPAAVEGGLTGMVVAGGSAAVAVAGVEVRDDAAYVHSVAVDPAARGRHVGSAVLAAVAARARRDGARWCGLLTESADGFFARHGFEPTDRATLPQWMQTLSDACTASAVAMRRELGI